MDITAKIMKKVMKVLEVYGQTTFMVVYKNKHKNYTAFQTAFMVVISIFE